MKENNSKNAHENQNLYFKKFKDKVKDASNKRNFNVCDENFFQITNTREGLHIFIGENNESKFSAIFESDDKVFNIKNDENGLFINEKESVDKEPNIDINEIREKSSNFFSKSKKTIEKIKKVCNKFNEATNSIRNLYKKTSKLLGTTFLATAIISSGFQVDNITNIAHDNNYNWENTKAEITEYYNPLYKEFTENKDIYSICKQDKSLCVASGAMVSFAASKSLALVGSGIAVMVADDVLEDKLTLNSFLKSAEKATGYSLTEETSNNKKVERELENQNENNKENAEKTKKENDVSHKISKKTRRKLANNFSLGL